MYGKKDADGKLLKNKEGTYINDITEEHHEKGRDDHSKRDATKN